MPNPKTTVLKVMQRQLNESRDNLARARFTFRGLSKEEMQYDYGASGRTRQEVLDGYMRRFEQDQAAMKWLKRQG